MEVARGMFLALTMFLFAPYIASFFGEPRATPIVQVIGLSPLLDGLCNPGVVYFKKDLEFHKEFIYAVSGSVANASVAISIALIYQSVWTLILGFVASDAARSYRFINME